jgi:hypothetical protein
MSGSKMSGLGISKAGINTALSIKQSYKKRQPLIIPGEADRLLVPEALLNSDIDLSSMDDPLALAMVSNRDPESSMALAAAARLSPAGAKNELLNGVVRIIGETSRHELVRECLKFVTDNAFEPESIGKIHQHAAKFVVESRKQFTAALRDNLRGLLDGDLAPREFVRDFFELTENGNLRHDIRKKLVLSLLLSSSVRPSIKFMMLENFHRMPKTVRHGIMSAVLKAEPNRHTEVIKEELKYIVLQERAAREQLDINGRPAPGDTASRESETMTDPYAASFPNPMREELHPSKPKPGFAQA